MNSQDAKLYTLIADVFPQWCGDIYICHYESN